MKKFISLILSSALLLIPLSSCEEEDALSGMSCTSCFGLGICYICSGTGKCPVCWGAKYEGAPCTYCHDKGKCLDCRGSGKCPDCKGKGVQ